MPPGWRSSPTASSSAAPCARSSKAAATPRTSKPSSPPFAKPSTRICPPSDTVRLLTVRRGLMRPIVATALLLSLQAAPLDEFYKFKAGTSWTYKRLEDNQERKLTGTVIGEEGGKVRV